MPTPTRSLDALAVAIAALRKVSDPRERVRAIRAVLAELRTEDARLTAELRDAILDLRAQTPPVTWAEIGELAGVTHQRAQQLAAPTNPDRNPR